MLHKKVRIGIMLSQFLGHIHGINLSFLDRFRCRRSCAFVLPVDNSGSIGRRHAPDQEKTFGQPIKRQPAYDDVGKGLEHRKSRKNNPIYQPLGVILFALGFCNYGCSISLGKIRLARRELNL